MAGARSTPAGSNCRRHGPGRRSCSLPRPHVRPGEMGSVMTARAAGRRILVVEDEPEVGMLIERVLTADGYVVSRARDGDHGLDLALGGGYSLVILDLIMPGMSGPEVLARLPREQPVLIVSCVSD